MEQPRLYLLVDESLPIGYQAAQCTHAAVQWIIENPDSNWKNDYLILLKVKNINKWIYKLNHLKQKFITFAEPDLNFKITSIATEADGKYFKKLKLVGSN